jgi:hypothetical protein
MWVRNNIKKVFLSLHWIIWITLGIVIIAVPSYYFIEKDIIIGNLWYTFYISEVIFNTLIALLFWLFLWWTVYKIHYFQIKKSSIWFLWWFLGLLISGCPACSITLASYLWLASVISIFPYFWLELKVLSTILLLYADYFIFKNLQTCNIKKKK